MYQVMHASHKLPVGHPHVVSCLRMGVLELRMRPLSFQQAVRTGQCSCCTQLVMPSTMMSYAAHVITIDPVIDDCLASMLAEHTLMG